MKTTVLNAHVYAIGIKNRCRKVDRHILELGDFPQDIDAETLKPQALKLLKSSMKSYTRAELVTQPADLETTDGFTIRSMMLDFTGKVRRTYSLTEVSHV